MADSSFGADENPFADPSVASVTSNAARGIEDFNPFADQSQPGASGPTTKSTVPSSAPPPQPAPTPTQPAVIETKQEPPPYSVVEEQENLRKRQEELERKAAELQRKEQELQRMQFTGYRENNFPPFPKWCKKCKPCFYHDIQVDIPIEYQKTCRALFVRWQAYCFVMFFNFVTALALMCVNPSGDSSDGETFGISIAYLLINIPASFLCWYRPAYKALKNDSSFSFIIFFLIYFIHIGINIYYTIGIPKGGACGFINATAAIHANIPVGAMMYICGCFFLVGVGVDILLLLKIHKIYRMAGASLEKAQGEFARGVATNEHVRAAATEAAVTGVREGMSNRK